MLNLFAHLLYVQLAPDKLTVRNPKTGKFISEAPELALQRDSKGKKRIVALGADVRANALDPGLEIVNPFSHPRTLISDFTSAEQVLKGFVKKLQSSSLFSPAPVMFLHPLVDPEGGFTQIEMRALRELALAAGARSVTIWQGPALTDPQLLAGQLPASGKAFRE